MAKRSLHKKRVAITGASSGIGWHLALQLAKEQADIVVCARREKRLAELKKEIGSSGGKCLSVAGDITAPQTRARLIETCETQLGGLDVLINNAGIGAMGRFDEAKEDRMREIFEVNFFAVANTIRESLPLMKRGNEPIIVNISSILGHRAAPLKSEYCASKFALHGFSDSIRAELTKDKIDLLLVSPSTTDSEFFDSAIEDKTGKNWKQRSAMPPDVVAAKTIRAIKKGKHEIILTHGGRFIVWLDRLTPGIANRVMARFGQ